ncbi:AraC family transcriptional regulator [Chryseobacterium sp. JUb7]|uniref:AraC family transcriptional regulator n=1 Tax=Chryseobacterium sp. JUb7 TaxID=2940599 RepID=UPI0021688978|nr:AraC family transcriptional regulator [Chryseobacterium sp. JUb7]MCS3529014.1 AraC-like DNA-binding protein [Chryseobacterium sp. JUb7]
MKIEKEIIPFENEESFKIHTPCFKNYFFWHYHPEIELVYVEAINGISHVGKHISGFVESYLVLIGPNIPHLNFDYGIETEYRQIVVQLKEDFPKNTILSTPEFAPVKKLLERSCFGLSFKGETKEKAVEKLKAVKIMKSFDALMGLIEVLYILAESTEVEQLNDEDTSVKFFLNDKVRMGNVYSYIHENYDKNPDVNTVAEMVHLSTSAFCRYFKKQTDMTFTDFVNQYRINQAKTLLLCDVSISEIAYHVGFESISYFNKLFKNLVGETPTDFKKKNKLN